MQVTFRIDDEGRRPSYQPGTVDLELPLALPTPNPAVAAFQRLEQLLMTTRTEVLKSLTDLSVKVAQNVAQVDALKTANAANLAARDARIVELEAQLAAATQSAGQIPDDVVQGVASVDAALSSLKDHISGAAPAPAPTPPSGDIGKVGGI